MTDLSHQFVEPTKYIKTVFDLNPWFFSQAYKDYLTFLRELNQSVIGVKTTDDVQCSEITISFVEMLDEIEKWIDEIPLEAVEDQRFGNKAYRKFAEKLKEESKTILESVLPYSAHSAIIELDAYFIDSFGNETRIDYGSGHEANFLIFLFCLKKLQVFTKEDNQALVLRIFNKYLRVCRFLQTKFKMEPAGSRGVHALDDFQFAPFIFGSAQLIGNKSIIPDSYLKKNIVEANAHISLFLEAVHFINQTKTGAFYEHSNQLWNISAVPHWKKVNEGMFKMYEGEVLKKFPVVQHIKFGSLFSFARRENIDESEVADAPPQLDVNVPSSISCAATRAPLQSASLTGPPRQSMQHGMFAFKIPSVAKTSNVREANIVETGDLKQIRKEKHPDEHCPPPMIEP